MNQFNAVNELLDAIVILEDAMLEDQIKVSRYKNIIWLKRHLRETPEEVLNSLSKKKSALISDLNRIINDDESGPEVMTEAESLSNTIIKYAK
tara:strand:- start:293 stop:571 length:279 start_codon:yes stop_codon:yes gene_type:complete